jgi:uncharacterized membrane protein
MLGLVGLLLLIVGIASAAALKISITDGAVTWVVVGAVLSGAGLMTAEFLRSRNEGRVQVQRDIEERRTRASQRKDRPEE